MSEAKHVLIVDDDPNILEVLDVRLSSAGFVVLRAARGAQALELLKNSRIDILVSDILCSKRCASEANAGQRYKQDRFHCFPFW